jgi:hypothetical protein
MPSTAPSHVTFTETPLLHVRLDAKEEPFLHTTSKYSSLLPDPDGNGCKCGSENSTSQSRCPATQGSFEKDAKEGLEFHSAPTSAAGKETKVNLTRSPAAKAAESTSRGRSTVEAVLELASNAV